MPYIIHFIRFVVSALTLLFVAFIVPGFHIHGFTSALLTAAVIVALGFIAEYVIGREISPYGRGLVGFVVTALILYAAQYIVAGVEVSVIGALLASLLIGIVDLFLPTPTKFWRAKKT
jgi:putative membrane protein